MVADAGSREAPRCGTPTGITGSNEGARCLEVAVPYLLSRVPPAPVGSTQLTRPGPGGMRHWDSALRSDLVNEYQRGRPSTNKGAPGRHRYAYRGSVPGRPLMTDARRVLRPVYQQRGTRQAECVRSEETAL